MRHEHSHMTRWLRFLSGLIALAVTSAVLADDSCKLESVDEGMSANHPVCLFYTGTQHFRNERYEMAAMSWDTLRQLPEIESEHLSLRISALNNLGYLYFSGFGVDADEALAVSYWRDAVSLGHDESEYHLCYALGNPDAPTFEPVTAKMHCDKAEAIYSFIKEPGESDKVILEIIRKYQALLDDV